jgi:hypothetical protein
LDRKQVKNEIKHAQNVFREFDPHGLIKGGAPDSEFDDYAIYTLSCIKQGDSYETVAEKLKKRLLEYLEYNTEISECLKVVKKIGK